MTGVREGRHLAAIMFMDMVGYSARMQRSEPAAIAAVRELWERVRPILAAHGGREVDLAGDGMLMEFSGALAAVQCALEVHQQLRKLKPVGDEDRVRVRAGIHLGDIEHRAGRIYGDGVNIAARVITVCPPGGVAMTPHVRDQLRNVLNEPLESLGLKSFKNIREPLEVWCLPGPDTSGAERAAARVALRTEGQDRRWSFGHAVFDERTLELTVAGKPVEIEKKSLDVLAFLLSHAGEVVTKDEIVDAAWPGRVISDSALTTSMTKLRAALGDEAQELIKTVHGYGYRLAAAVTVETPASQAQAPAFDFKEGDPLPQRPHWKLVRSLGAGGHGEAWLARHEKTGEQRVYKFALDHSHLASLKREITLSRVLGAAPGAKDAFVTVLDWNLEQLPYFVESEYASGGSLLDWASAQGGIDKVPRETRLELVAQAAEAVARAHAMGVLHKDLKPANLLIETGAGAPRVKLADFGTGGVVDTARLAELGITRMGFTKTMLDTDSSDSATALYLAPEVLAGQPWTAQADVYALGLMLFQAVTGDFRATLAPGWEKDVADPFLREDIALAAAGDPAERLKDAAELASRLRGMPRRREEQKARLAAADKAARQQKALDRYRYRRWWTAVLAMLVTVMFFGWVFMETANAHTFLIVYSAMNRMGKELENEGKFDRAEQIYRAIYVAEANRPTRIAWDSEFLYEAESNLARVAVKQGRFDEAEHMFGILLAEVDRETHDWHLGIRASSHFGYGRFLLEHRNDPRRARQQLEIAKALLAQMKADDPDAGPQFADFVKTTETWLEKASQATNLPAKPAP